MTGATLDHIVILVSHQTLLSLPALLSPYLTVSQGGRHADGLTWNHLILLEDGVYIELIAFFDGVDPERRKAHRWGQQAEGTIVDWACSLPREDQFGDIQARVDATNAGFSFSNLVAGGRTTPEGTVLKWSIGTPVDELGHETQTSILPFWCLDRTPRKLRVPYKNNTEATTHTCGATGVSRLVVTVPENDIDSLRRVYLAINAPVSKGTEKPDWSFAVPSGSKDARHSLHLEAGDKPEVKLALVGHADSPSFLEILPGLVIKMD